MTQIVKKDITKPQRPLIRKVNFMKLSHVLKAFFATSLLAPLAWSGGDHSGGGDQCLQKLQSVRSSIQQAYPKIKSIKQMGLNEDAFLDALNKAKFETGENLETTVDGKDHVPVDALNYPKKGLIVMDKNHCSAVLSSLDDAMGFLVHEVMALAKIDDTSYQYSKTVLNELKGIVVIQNPYKQHFVCAVQRHHYSGRAGSETIALMDTFYGNEFLNSGYLYSRTDNATDEYVVTLYVNRGMYGEKEPKLEYGFYKEPRYGWRSKKRAPYNRITLVESWTEVSFKNEQDGSETNKVVIPLLGKRAFNDEGSFLQMVCYRGQ